MKWRVLLVVLFFTCSNSFGQNNAAIDSLQKLVKETNDGERLAELHYQLANQYTNNNVDSAFTMAHKAALLYASLPPSEFSARNYAVLGRLYAREENFTQSEKFYKLAIAVAIKLNNVQIEWVISHNYFADLQSILPPNRQIEYNLSLVEKCIEQGNDSILFLTYQDLATQYTHSDNQTEKISFYADKMIEIAERKNNTYFNFVSYFYKANTSEGEESIEYFQKCFPYLNGNRSNLTSLCNNISLRYARLGDFELALFYSDSAYKVSKEIGRVEGMAAARLNGASIYLLKEEHDLAIEYAKEALNLFKSGKIIRRQNHCLEVISDAYAAKGDYEQAYKYYQLEEMMIDSFNKVAEVAKLRLVESKFEYELAQKQDSVSHAKEIAINRLALEGAKERLEKEKAQRYALYGGSSLVLLLAIVMIVGFVRKRRDNKIIQQQKTAVEKQKEEIELQHEEIKDSITYAKRIQNAILPPNKQLAKNLPNSFVLYLPKSIVAGDFYWMELANNGVLFAAADCTGHGVPGAIVSVVCHNALNRSVREFGLNEPAKILDKTRDLVIETFEASDEEVKDGMDIALCKLSPPSKSAVGGRMLQYAGANNKLILIKANAASIEDVIEVNADKQPIGVHRKQEPFTNHTIQLEPGDTFYVFTDGFIDQFGGPKGKKLMIKEFKNLLFNLKDVEMSEQQISLQKTFNKWKGSLEQVDDICVIGVRI